jgi:hypothetical protein
MEIPERYEPLGKPDVTMIIRSVGPSAAMILGLEKTDLKAGVGILGPSKKCIWLKDGRRVTLSIGGGAMVASATKIADPLALPENRS